MTCTSVKDGTVKKAAAGMNLRRFDFVVTIEPAMGESRKVFIEMHKAYSIVDIIHFSETFDEHYNCRNVRNEQDEILSVIHIYILADKCPRLNPACIRVKGSLYYDAVHGQYIDERDLLIEQLSYECVVVQMSQIEYGRNETILDKFLSLFEERRFFYKESYKDYLYKIDDDNIRRIINILHNWVNDPKERQRIEYESEVCRLGEALLNSVRPQFTKIYEETAIIRAETKRICAEIECIRAETKRIHEENETFRAELKK
jgi:hypothetical protein